jgi:multisubunit Na+/H+ antiporter MnhG subunit
VCGAAAVAAPAELEVLRQRAETHAAYRGVLVGTVGVVLSFLTFALILALKGAAHLTPAVVFSLMWAVPGLLSLAFGLRRMNRSLTREHVTDMAGEANRLTGSPGGNLSLPEHHSRSSITEGTTGLLATPRPQRRAVPVKGQGVDTDPLS